MIKFIKDESYITLLFNKKEGGPVTIYDTDSLYNAIYVFATMENSYNIFKIESLCGFKIPDDKNAKEKAQLLREAINSKIKLNRSYFDLYQIINRCYIASGVEGKRSKDKIIFDLLKTLKNDDIEATIQKDVINKNIKNVLKTVIDRGFNIKKVFKGTSIKIVNGVVLYKNEPLKEMKLVDHILRYAQVGIKANSYINFLDNVMKNPKTDIRFELFEFLSNGMFPIHEDGTFSAFKKVRSDWRDIYSNTIDHSIGKKPKLSKKDVDYDRSVTCSSGLHFCGWDYLRSYGGYDNVRIIEVKINPKDVVAIPTDYNYLKGRCLTYEVIREIEKPEQLYISI